MLLKTRQRGFCADRFCSIGIGGAILGGAAIGGLTSILGGNKVKNAAEDAGEVSAQQYQQTRSDLSPWTASGGNALNAYDKALGLGGTWANTPLTGAEWGKSNPYTQNHWSAQNLMDRAPEGYQISAYNKYLADFDKGEFTPNERQEMPMYGQFAPPPGSELPTYTPGADLAQYNPTAGASPYTAQGYVPGYTPTEQAPEYQSQGQFNFDLQNDPIYQFQRDEALRATDRKYNAMDMGVSGNVLAALNDRAANVAGTYQNEAFGRQLAGSQENYGRGVQDYSIADARGADNYNRNVQDYNIDAGRGREIYGRGVQDYGINFDVNRDAYSRGAQDYGINANTNNTMFNRGISNYGIGTDAANALYNRGQNEWNLNDYGMNQDIYGREQNYLNRLAAQSGGGQNAAAALGGFGANAASNIGQFGMAGGQAQANQYQGVNNAAQGSISNYLTHDLYSNNPYLAGNNTNYLGNNLDLGSGGSNPFGGYGYA